MLPSMRISSLEAIPYALPFREGYVTARGSLRRREMVLLRLRSGEGFVGLGEAVPLSLRGGVTLGRVVEELEQLGELEEMSEATLDGDAAGLSAPARCAALTALMDLRGRRAAAEGHLSSPLSGQPIRCNATLVAGEPEKVAEDALRWAEEGFSTFKLKLGAETAKTRVEQGSLRFRDVEQVRAVRKALGPDARIRVDANEAWDLETAKRALTELEPLGVELAEQPVAGLREMAELAEVTSIPLSADESVATLEEAKRAVAVGACAYTGVKLSKVGGPEEAIAIAGVLPAYISSALDGPVGIAAAAQVAQTLAEQAGGAGLGLAHGLATQRLFASTIAAVECELKEGCLHPPAGPGLGVEVDEDALEAHRL